MLTKTEKELEHLKDAQINKMVLEYQEAYAQAKIHKQRREKLKAKLIKLVKIKSNGSKYLTNKYSINVNTHTRWVIDLAKLAEKLGQAFLDRNMKKSKSSRLEILRRKK